MTDAHRPMERLSLKSDEWRKGRDGWYAMCRPQSGPWPAWVIKSQIVRDGVRIDCVDYEVKAVEWFPVGCESTLPIAIYIKGEPNRQPLSAPGEPK